ncbi:hypothetical protein EPN81_01635 [Patescibacteria group bacterium]|nr:MAG: hypothetical protein EPN81_01635 [Patescibacteria group bacterium]
MSKPSTALVLKMTATLSAREILRWPLWWYTDGARDTLKKLARSVGGSVRYFGVDVWAKNLFIPMYGDTSIIGRALSFGVRLVVLMFRSLGVVLWIVIALVLAMMYLLILPLAFIGFFLHLVGVISFYA